MLRSGVEVLLWRRHLKSKRLIRVEELSQRLAAVEEGEGVGEDAAAAGKFGEAARQDLEVVLHLERLPVLRHLADGVLDRRTSALVEGVLTLLDWLALHARRKLVSPRKKTL